MGSLLTCPWRHSRHNLRLSSVRVKGDTDCTLPPYGWGHLLWIALASLGYEEDTQWHVWVIFFRHALLLYFCLFNLKLNFLRWRGTHLKLKKKYHPQPWISWVFCYKWQGRENLVKPWAAPGMCLAYGNHSPCAVQGQRWEPWVWSCMSLSNVIVTGS